MNKFQKTLATFAFLIIVGGILIDFGLFSCGFCLIALGSLGLMGHQLGDWFD